MLDKKKIKRYIAYTISTLLFGLIYEIFSFGVYSKFMVFAFIYPLIGLIINFIVYNSNNKLEFPIMIFDMSMLTFTLGSILKGVLEIYGTTNVLLNYYNYLGISLLILCVLLTIFVKRKKNL